MHSNSAALVSPVGLIAGSGSLPIEFTERARALGLEVVAIGHRGETDPALESLCQKFLWVRVGQLGTIISALKRFGATQVAFAGGISRIKLFGGFRPDWTGIRMLSRMKSFRDDAILRAIAGEIESAGMKVIGATVLLDKSLAKRGALSRRRLCAQERLDARVGFEVGKAIGAQDVGQTVVTFDGLVLAVEAIEGTDAAIRRGGELARAKRAESGPVVVKTCKPTQDERFDLPTIGVRTIESMHAVRATALVVEAGKTLVLDPQKVVETADSLGIAIEAVTGLEDLVS